MQKKLYLEFVRGVAAILVVITHLSLLDPSKKLSRFFAFTNWGTEAVMVFFILSGIVINISQTRAKRPAKLFIFNRLARIYPQFTISILLALLVYWILYKDLPSMQIIVGNFFMVDTLQGFIVGSIRTNNPVWSLTFEMSFYLLFALGIFFQRKTFFIYWLVAALFAIPLYFLNIHSGILAHVIAIFSFSSIWLLGFYIYEYRTYFHSNVYTALFSLGLLPLMSRLHLTNQYYDPLKYLLFAIIAIPFFRYCIDQRRQGYNLKLIHLVPLYICFGYLLLVYSDSLLISKILYLVFPVALVFIFFLLHKMRFIEHGKKGIEFLGATLGKYSFSIYIIHYPILILCAKYFDNLLSFLAVGILLLIVAVWFLENHVQKFVSYILRHDTKNKTYIPTQPFRSE